MNLVLHLRTQLRVQFTLSEVLRFVKNENIFTE